MMLSAVQRKQMEQDFNYQNLSKLLQISPGSNQADEGMLHATETNMQSVKVFLCLKRSFI